LLFSVAVALLQFAGELVALLSDDGEVNVREVAPCLFDLAGDLLPVP
jgi:hypothetical protein